MLRAIFIDSNNINKYLKTLSKLDVLCFGPDEYAYPFDSTVDGCRHVWWLIKDTNNDKFVAYAGLKIYKSKKNAFLCRAGVIKSYRKRGLHKKLLDLRINYAKKTKIENLYSYTSVENFRSANNLILSKFKLCDPWFQCTNPYDFFYFCRKP